MGIAPEIYDMRVWKTKEKRMVYEVTFINPLFDWENDCILMLATGKRDKNNIRIFDKDIVNVAYINGDTNKTEYVKYIVEYDKDVLAWKISPVSGKQSEYFFEFEFNSEEFEVIGNIYQDTGLLKVKGNSNDELQS